MPAPWAYFDTSVLVKRYVKEPGSARARALLRRYHFLSSAITPVEAMSALCRRRAAGDLADKDFGAILSRIERDRPYWELVEVSPVVLAEAERLIRRTAVRTLDALHVASAITFQTVSGSHIPFVTGDGRQRIAAEETDLDLIWVP